MPTIPSSTIEPIWEQFDALLPPRAVAYPLGRHRPRIPDHLIFDKLVQVLAFGRMADDACSTTTLRRRDEWVDAGS